MKMSYRKMKLAEIGKIVSGATPKTSTPDNFGGDIAWITPADLSGYTKKYISHGKRNITEMGYNSCSTQLMPKGSVLFSSRAPIGYVAIAENPLCTNQGFKSIVPNDLIDSEFLYYQLKYLSKSIQDKGTGTTFKEISAKTLGKIEIVVPLLSEQKNIVSRIEELFSKLDKGVETLQTTKQQLAVYRQTVLTASFPPITSCNRRKLSDIAIISSGITKGRKLHPDETIKLPYLRVANVQNGFLDLTEVKEIDLKESEKEKFLLKYGDVLYTEGGDRDKLGRGTIWRDEIPNCVHQNHIFKARVDKSQAIPQYVTWWSMSSHARDYFFEKGKQTVNLASINKTVLANLELPLPSLQEQEKITEIISSRFSSCDSIERTVDRALAQTDAMRQSILKRAFEGKL